MGVNTVCKVQRSRALWIVMTLYCIDLEDQYILFYIMVKTELSN